MIAIAIFVLTIPTLVAFIIVPINNLHLGDDHVPIANPIGIGDTTNNSNLLIFMNDHAITINLALTGGMKRD